MSGIHPDVVSGYENRYFITETFSAVSLRLQWQTTSHSGSCLVLSGVRLSQRIRTPHPHSLRILWPRSSLVVWLFPRGISRNIFLLVSASSKVYFPAGKKLQISHLISQMQYTFTTAFKNHGNWEWYFLKEKNQGLHVEVEFDSNRV